MPIRIVLTSLALGGVVGVITCGFQSVLRFVGDVLLRGCVGVDVMLPAGDAPLPRAFARSTSTTVWVVLVPMLGGLAAGFVSRLAGPASTGRGMARYVAAFDRDRPEFQHRTPWVTMIATLATLGSGGSAGRAGPSLLVGSSLASSFARVLGLPVAEQRLLLVAGAAAGVSALFGAPFGAALLAVEVIRRDRGARDALVPALLASSSAYAVYRVVAPSSRPLFAHSGTLPLSGSTLAACVALALVIAIAGRLFMRTLHATEARFARVACPILRPALGGLAFGCVAAAWMHVGASELALGRTDVGVFGAGFGAAQGALANAPWVPGGWEGVAFFAVFAMLKILTTSLTLGSSGCGGDLGPSLVIGALLGGATGGALRLIVGPTIDVGAFALVGMTALYAGLANAPIGALVLVCELSGTTDLMVPSMLVSGLACVLLSGVDLYPVHEPHRVEQRS